MRHPGKTNRRHVFDRARVARRGMVLIVVMVVIVIVSLAGFAFAALMFTERKAVQLHGDELQLETAVDSGEEVLKALLARSAESRIEDGGIVDNPERLRGVVVFEDEDDGRRARFSIVSPRMDNGEITGIRFGVEDESGRLNLALLPEWERRQPGSAMQALLRLPGMTESAADSILDWIDADPEPRPLGAEDDYYSGLESAHSARNAAPESLEELLLVKDVTRNLLFGPDTNRNYVVDEIEQLSQTVAAQPNKAQTQALPWSAYLTTNSAERNLTPDGRQRIDLNSGNLMALNQSLTEALDARWAKFIVAYRQYGPCSGSTAGTPDSGDALDFTRQPKVRIESIYVLVGTRVEIPSSLPDKPATILASPVRDDRESMRRDLPRLLDAVSVVNAPVISGRINVNTASQVVLSAVPGLDGALAEQIVSARAAQVGSPRPETQHACWLLTDGLVDVPKMKALAPYLTGGGDVFRGQIVGFWDDPGSSARVELLIDASVLPPQVLSRMDLRLLGSGFSPEELGAETPDEPKTAPSHGATSEN